MSSKLSGSLRVNNQPAFLLSSSPWRESSLLIELFSRDYGRLSLVARSARRRQSELRGVLVPFVPISASWYGRESLKTLHRAEWTGGWPQPQNINLFSSLYVNELMMKLTVREEPQPILFDALSTVLHALCTGHRSNAALRLFEWILLQQNGSTPDLCRDQNGKPIDPALRYLAKPQQAFCLYQDGTADGPTVSGSALCALYKRQLEDPSHLTEILHLNRLLIDQLIPEGLTSRRIMQQIQQLKSSAPTR